MTRYFAETALLLGETESEGGVWTPTALLGEKLRDRLAEKAGLTFRAG